MKLGIKQKLMTGTAAALVFLGTFTSTLRSSAQTKTTRSAASPQIKKPELPFTDTTGEILDNNGQSIKSDSIVGTLLRKCNEFNIPTLFIGNFDHTKYKKNSLVIHAAKDMKENGFAFGVEISEEKFHEAMTIQDQFGYVRKSKYYKDATVKDFLDQKDIFINNFAANVANSDNAREQAETYWKLFIKLKQFDVPVKFCEPDYPSAEYAKLHFDKIKNDFIGFLNPIIQSSNAGNDKDYARANRLLSDIGQNPYAFQGDGMQLFMEVYAQERDSALHNTGKTLYERGANHMLTTNGLNSKPEFKNNITAFNFETIDGLKDMFLFFDGIQKTYKSLLKIEKDDKDLSPELNKKLQGWAEIVRPHEGLKSELKLVLPDYFMIVDKPLIVVQPGQTTEIYQAKLYKADVYLKTHDINGNVVAKDSKDNIWNKYEVEKLIGNIQPAKTLQR